MGDLRSEKRILMGVRVLAPERDIWHIILSKDAVFDSSFGDLRKSTNVSYTSEIAALAYFLTEDATIKEEAETDKLRIPGIAYFEADGALHDFVPDFDVLFPHRNALVCYQVLES